MSAGLAKLLCSEQALGRRGAAGDVQRALRANAGHAPAVSPHVGCAGQKFWPVVVCAHADELDGDPLAVGRGSRSQRCADYAPNHASPPDIEGKVDVCWGQPGKCPRPAPEAVR